MHDRQSLSHVTWECKYHVVIIPRYRGEVFYGRLRRQIGPSLGSYVGGELISDN
jgi:putative transposase